MAQHPDGQGRTVESSSRDLPILVSDDPRRLARTIRKCDSQSRGIVVALVD